MSLPETTNGRAWSRITFAAIAAAFVVPLLAFGPSYGGEFVYDSVFQIAVDDFIHTPANLWDVLSFRVLAMDMWDSNRPVCLLSLMLDSLLWGRKPFGFHLTNILIHAINTALLCAVLICLMKRAARRTQRLQATAIAVISVLLALCFALHPVVTEAVCVGSFREDLLVTLFVLMSLLVLDASIDEPRPARLLVIMGVLQLLAIGSKESGIALAPVAMVYWLSFCKPESRRLVLGLGGVCGVVVVVFLAARFSLPPDDSEIFVKLPRTTSPSPIDWFVSQAQIWTFQARTLVDPRLLSAQYPLDKVYDMVTKFSLALAGCAGLVVAWAAWKLRYCRIGVVIVITAMLPVANIVPIYIPAADRYLYLPLAGIVMALAGALVSLNAGRASTTRHLVVAATGVLLLLLPLLGYANIRRQSVFTTSLSMWEDADRKYPESWYIMTRLAVNSLHSGAYDQAEEYFEAVLAQLPSFSYAHLGMALTQFELGDRERARTHLVQAIEIDERILSLESLPAGAPIRSLGVEKVRRLLDDLEID